MASKMGDSILAWLGGIVSGALVGVGVAYLATGGGQSTPATPASPSGGSPPSSGGTTAGATPPPSTPVSATPPASFQGTWASLPAGNAVPQTARVRFAMTPAQAQAIASAGTPADVMAYFTNKPIMATAVTVYPPGSKLPDDWPTSDPNPAAEWHIDLEAPNGIAVSLVPANVMAWTYHPPTGNLLQQS